MEVFWSVFQLSIESISRFIWSCLTSNLGFDENLTNKKKPKKKVKLNRLPVSRMRLAVLGYYVMYFYRARPDQFIENID